MALLKYLKVNKDGLAQANREVQQLLSQENGGKRGPYNKYIYPYISVCIASIHIMQV